MAQLLGQCEYCGIELPDAELFGPEDHRCCSDCFQEDEEDEEQICSACNGSGEGMYEGTRCWSCHGKGILK